MNGIGSLGALEPFSRPLPQLLRLAAGLPCAARRARERLAEPLVRHRAAQRRLDIGMSRKQEIQFQRGDLHAAARDDVLSPPDQLDRAICLHPGKIARLEVAVDEGGGRQPGVIEVPQHAVRRSDRKLAGLAGRYIASFPAVLAIFDALGRHADGSVLQRTRGSADRSRRSGLGRAVEVEDSAFG